MTSGDGTAGERSPLERAVDLFVYAPLGVVLAARDELPRFIAKGRSETEGQVGMARVVGQFAVDRGQKEAGKLLRQATERLAGLGLVPAPAGRASPPPAPAGPAPAPAPAPGPGAAADPGPAGGARRSGDRPGAASLAIPGYDSLSAPHVVQRLDGLSDDELEAVRAYETANRGRRTILGRIAQLQSAP